MKDLKNQEVSNAANTDERIQYVQLPAFQNAEFAASEDIDFKVLFTTFWDGKFLIAACAFFTTILGVLYALYLPNIYNSDALLSPVSAEQQGNLSALAGQFGGLASLAGINLGGEGSEKSELALEVVISREFIKNFIEKHNLLVDLMATEGWSIETNELLYDEDIYSFDESTWVRDVSPPFKPKPSNFEAYEAFMEIFSVVPRKDSGMVIFSIRHYSPIVAKQWVDWLVEDINAKMKARDQVEATKSINYLEGQLDQTSIAEHKSLLYQLIEEQTKTLMFTEIRDEYIFETVDPAVVAEEKYAPKRAVIVLLALILGGFIGCCIVLIRSMRSAKSQS